MERIRQALIAHSANRGDPVVSDLLADLDVELQQCADMATSIHLSSRHQAVGDTDTIHPARAHIIFNQIIASDILERSRLSNGLLGINTTDFNLLEEMQAIIRLYDCQARSAEIHLSLQAGTSICASTRMRSDITRIIQVAVQTALCDNVLTGDADFIEPPLQCSQILASLLSSQSDLAHQRHTHREMKDGLRVCTVHIDLLDAAPTYERSTPALNAAESICSPETKYFSVSVKDNGVGISDAEINSLFTKFVSAVACSVIAHTHTIVYTRIRSAVAMPVLVSVYTCVASESRRLSVDKAWLIQLQALSFAWRRDNSQVYPWSRHYVLVLHSGGTGCTLGR